MFDHHHHHQASAGGISLLQRLGRAKLFSWYQAGARARDSWSQSVGGHDGDMPATVSGGILMIESDSFKTSQKSSCAYA